MKNPLRKRLLRELKNDIGKYLVIFLFMTATIGFVSGFLVADESMLYAYDESFEKYNVENGNFTTEQKLTDNQRTRLEKEKVTIYENFYKDEDADTDLDSEPESTIRLFKTRTEFNLVCLMKGEMPQQKDEIAIDRMYADNNDLQVGDVISVDKKELTVTGLVALSDYSALFSNSSDMMFDAVKFGVGIMTEEGYDAITDDHIKYCYSWKYDTEPKDENEEKEWSDDFVEVLAAHSSLTGYLPRYGNQAIKFTGDDMGGDKAMVEVLLYILIAIMAFIFAVTTNNTIVKEASVIGTLRASGYTRRELLLHYLSLPVLITILSAVIGNILGYTVFKDICAGMYYGSYSLPTYQTRWNANAFLLTTVIPAILMFVINAVLISGRLRLSPLRFLRHDFAKKGKSHAVRLPNFRFFSRFRLRILLQNKSSYFTLFLGIVFANILLLFGMMMKPLLSHYQTEAVENMLADYQYILNVPDPIDEDDEYTLMGIVQKLLTPSLKTNTEGVETFALTSLKNIPKNREGESISVYGIQKDSKYVSAELFEDGVTISDGYAEKYGMKVGDTLERSKICSFCKRIPERAIEKIEYHKYTAVPVLNKKGCYVGTLTEGDLLRIIKERYLLNYHEAEDIPLWQVPKRWNYESVNINSNIEDLIEMSMRQNFVPVVDDEGIFIGIIRRRDIIQYCYQKSGIKEEEEARRSARKQNAEQMILQ